MLPGIAENVKGGVKGLWLLSAPEPVTVMGGLSRLLGKLGGLMICRLSSEELVERSKEGEEWTVDVEALDSFRGVRSASLSASVPFRFFISSESESVSRLLSDSAERKTE